VHRLIVETEDQLNASFCGALVSAIGKCEVIPLTGNFCVIEGFKMDDSATHFERLLKCTVEHTKRAFLVNTEGDLDMQLEKFLEVEYCGMYTIDKPPFGLWSVSNSNNGLFHILPWGVLSPDNFDTVC